METGDRAAPRGITAPEAGVLGLPGGIEEVEEEEAEEDVAEEDGRRLTAVRGSMAGGCTVCVLRTESGTEEPF